VMATPNGPEHVTIEYNGPSHRAFLAALACMRTLVDGEPLRLSTRSDEIYVRERAAALEDNTA
jgi:hypothetical protein